MCNFNPLIEPHADLVDQPVDMLAARDGAVDRLGTMIPAQQVNLAPAAHVHEIAVQKADAAAAEIARPHEIIHDRSAGVMKRDDHAVGAVVGQPGFGAELGPPMTLAPAIQLRQQLLLLLVGKPQGIDTLISFL
jgi:hypothetical protein